MSSSGSGALTIEFPRMLLAERVTVVLLLATAAVIEWVAAQHTGAPAGVGLACGACLGAWHWLRRHWVSCVISATVGSDGAWQLALADGRVVAAGLLPGSRLLGPSLLLRWRTGQGVRSAWVTTWDVPAARLRDLRVRLMASSIAAGA
jgi:hypothetical protein